VTDPAPGVSPEEHARLERWFQRHWEDGVAFNRHAGIRVQRWAPDGVELFLPFKEELSSHEGIFHGGVLAALIDTSASASVLAGHDFNKGSRLSTITMTVNYLAPAPYEDAVAYATTTKRGGRVHYAEVRVRSSSGRDMAQGLVVVSISGHRPGAG
jgi:uncharacterized protein (TIGR00369 family)